MALCPGQTPPGQPRCAALHQHSCLHGWLHGQHGCLHLQPVSCLGVLFSPYPASLGPLLLTHEHSDRDQQAVQGGSQDY